MMREPLPQVLLGFGVGVFLACLDESRFKFRVVCANLSYGGLGLGGLVGCGVAVGLGGVGVGGTGVGVGLGGGGWTGLVGITGGGSALVD